MGGAPHGLSSPLEAALRVAQWVKDVRDRLRATTETSRDLRRLLLEGSADELTTLSDFAADPVFVDTVRLVQEATQPLSELASHARQRATLADDVIVRCRQLGLSESLSLAGLVGLADDLDRVSQIESKFDRHEAISGLIGEGYQGSASDIGPLSRALRLVDSVRASKLPTELQSWLLESNARSRTDTLNALSAEGYKAVDDVVVEAGLLEKAFGDSLRGWLMSDHIGKLAPSDLYKHARSTADDDAGLSKLVRDAQLLKELEGIGLDGFVKALSEREGGLPGLPEACRYVLYRSILKSLLARSSALINFSQERFEGLRRRFRDLDVSLQKLWRKTIVDGLLTRSIDRGSDRGPRREWTGLKMIELVTGQQRPRISIRHFLQQAGQAVQQLMPCFMMSPLSVAQYLPRKLTFDLMVMDEASQIRPEDAAGAIARCRQVVVVGDRNQLPPTPFFMEKIPELDEEEEVAVADEESILDVGSQILPMKRLCWHYRSRHGSLIAFSNHEFYDDSLIVFPSPKEKLPEAGVRYEHVAEGCYEPNVGINRPEVGRIVQAVVAHARQRPNRSLGVVALNVKQAELLRTRIEAIEDPDFLLFCEKWRDTLEPFFVKNLENVQGDERDVIMISTVYGKDANGCMFQRFGPINQAGGHRRLNVLFTRAKYQVIVYSSMTPSDIRVDAPSSRGVRVLQAYLKYAQERGFGPEVTGRATESEFEESVLFALRGAGYEGVPQVGVSGYRIDIAVCHPARPGEFVLGVECDGATYHSAKSARDRDRLRQQVLENLGWSIYRIWSMEWFRDPKGQTDRLLAAVRRAIAASEP
jgi:very-short-patch-repair endonuclease